MNVEVLDTEDREGGLAAQAVLVAVSASWWFGWKEVIS